MVSPSCVFAVPKSSEIKPTRRDVDSCVKTLLAIKAVTYV